MLSLHPKRFSLICLLLLSIGSVFAIFTLVSRLLLRREAVEVIGDNSGAIEEWDSWPLRLSLPQSLRFEESLRSPDALAELLPLLPVRELRFLDVPNFDRALAKGIGSIQTLRVLDIQYCGLIDSDIGYFSRLNRLEQLYLAEPALSNVSVKWFESMTSLESLYLVQTGIDEKEREGLERALHDTYIAW